MADVDLDAKERTSCAIATSSKVMELSATGKPALQFRARGRPTMHHSVAWCEWVRVYVCVHVFVCVDVLCVCLQVL